MRALVLFFSWMMLASAVIGADPYVGTWQSRNGQRETFGFSLRSDGKGFFSTPTYPVGLRWERTATGLLLKLDNEGGISEISLTYDAATKTMVRELPGGEAPQRYLQISAGVSFEEAREQNRKEGVPMPEPKQNRQEMATRAGVLEAFQKWLERAPAADQVFVFGVRPADTSFSFSVSAFENSLTVLMPILNKSLEKDSTKLRYQSAMNSREPDLPMRFAVPKPKVEKLRLWLTERRIRFAEMPSEARHEEKVTGYMVMLNIHLERSETETILGVTRYLIEEFFDEAPLPFHVMMGERPAQ